MGLVGEFGSRVCAGSLAEEIADPTVHCIIFEGFKAFYDRRVVELLDICVWLQVPYDVAKKRRMERPAGWSAEHFDKEVWPNHEIYAENVLFRLQHKLLKAQGDGNVYEQANAIGHQMREESAIIGRHIDEAQQLERAKVALYLSKVARYRYRAKNAETCAAESRNVRFPKRRHSQRT